MIRDKVGIKIGITGMPGAGKTYVLRKIIELLESEGKEVGGIITESIIVKNERKGFKIIDWGTKREGILAHVKSRSKIRVSKYGVDLKTLDEIGIPAIDYAITHTDVIVIDEVGKMELESEKFIEVVKRALDVDKIVILTLHKKSRHPLLQDIRRRDDIRILEVTPINKDLLPYKVVRLIHGELLS